MADDSLSVLEPVRILEPIADNAIPAITIVHNEGVHLRDFVRHYRAIGVRRFIVVDHCSTDDTSAFLLAQPDVDLYRTEASYALAVMGQVWVTGLARKVAMGRWALHVDADEHLVYNGMDRHCLSDLSSLIERQGKTRLYAPMVDMYPRGPIINANVHPHTKLVDVAPYFDPLVADGCTYYERSEMAGCAGLFNYRRGMAFSGADFQQDDGKPTPIPVGKYPLSKWNDKTAYCCVHYPHPLAENSSLQLAALLHFKFVGNFSEHSRDLAKVGQSWLKGAQHAAYADTIERQNHLSLYHNHSRRYEGPDSLVREGFIESPPWTEANR